MTDPTIRMSGGLNPRAKLLPSDIRSIRLDTRTHREIAISHGVSEPAIFKIKSGMTWRHVP